MKRGEMGKFSIAILTFTLLSLILIFFSGGQEKILLALLPLIYGTFFISLAKVHQYFNYPGMFVLNVIAIIRYILIPTLIMLDASYVDEYGTLLQGIIFMVFEAVCLGIFINFIIRRYYSGKKLQERVEIKDNGNIVLKLVVISAICIITLNPTILSQYNFVFMSLTDAELIKRSTLVTGLSGLIVDWGKLFLPLLVVIPLIKKYRVNKNDIYYYLVLFFILAFNVMIFSGTSRNSVIMPAAASLFFLLKAFPDKNRRTFIMMSLSIVVVALQLTVLKTEYLGTKIHTSLGSIIDYLEAYFGGPKNMGIAITAKEMYSSMFSISTFLTDIFGNFPGLSQFFNLENRTATFYNLVFYNGGLARDQIIPSMGQGLFYFGYLLSFIPQMLIVFGMAKFDSMYRGAKDLVYLYFLSYFAVRFGFTYVQNVSIILSFVYAMIIPITVILLINQTINKKIIFRRSMNYAKNKALVCNKQR